MSHCSLIQDVLPLYVDDAVSPESRRLVEEHLAGCPACRHRLAELQAPLPAALPPAGAEAPEDARFLLRLKRNAGTALGLVLVLLAATAFGAHQYGRQGGNSDYHLRQQELRAEEQTALTVLRDLSPDPAGLLAARGVTYGATAERDPEGLKVAYRVVAPSGSGIELWTPLLSGYRRDFRLLDPATGQELDWDPRGGSGSWHQGQGSGTYRFGNPPSGPSSALFEFPPLLAHLPVDVPPAWNFRRPGPTGEVRLDQRLSLHGVEFAIDRVLFKENRVRVEYRQLTDPTRVGVHLLSMRLSDGLGGGWGQSPLGHLPDPHRPYQEFDFVNSPSQNWSLSVEHAVLAVPGPRVPVEVP